MGAGVAGSGGGRAPNAAGYLVALAGIALLLIALCCYLLYFCVRKISEASPECTPLPSAPRPAPPPRYPVQPEVREGASAMALLCSQLPSSAAVHPSPSRAPAKEPGVCLGTVVRGA